MILRQIQAHLQAIYRTTAPDVAHFQIDAVELRSVLGPHARHADEWVLVRERDGFVDLAVFVADVHLQALETTQSLAQAAMENFAAFCAATEGVSHFLMLIERARREEPVSLLELEAQAEVDKFVCARLHHPSFGETLWKRLFLEAELAEGLSSEEIVRYQEAGRLAGGFCAELEKAPHVDAILRTLRSFWRESGAKRLDIMRRLAA